MKDGYIYDTPLGPIGLAEREGALTNVFFAGTVQPGAYTLRQTPLLQRASAQLLAYLSAARRTFDLPLAPEGTPFEKAVWQALMEIPYGQTRTYGQLAATIGRPAASRAVGRANSRNPLSIIVPCHRVIGAHGALVGYAGGLAMKKQLLRLEGVL
nr:methylated-DNA--[protein]-cysteine S-methyltransferase [Maliibacterium massiliense]